MCSISQRYENLHRAVKLDATTGWQGPLTNPGPYGPFVSLFGIELINFCLLARNVAPCLVDKCGTLRLFPRREKGGTLSPGSTYFFSLSGSLLGGFGRGTHCVVGCLGGGGVVGVVGGGGASPPPPISRFQSQFYVIIILFSHFGPQIRAVDHWGCLVSYRGARG